MIQIERNSTIKMSEIKLIVLISSGVSCDAHTEGKRRIYRNANATTHNGTVNFLISVRRFSLKAISSY